jgi:hypothetical protein
MVEEDDRGENMPCPYVVREVNRAAVRVGKMVSRQSREIVWRLLGVQGPPDQVMAGVRLLHTLYLLHLRAKHTPYAIATGPDGMVAADTMAVIRIQSRRRKHTAKDRTRVALYHRRKGQARINRRTAAAAARMQQRQPQQWILPLWPDISWEVDQGEGDRTLRRSWNRRPLALSTAVLRTCRDEEQRTRWVIQAYEHQTARAELELSRLLFPDNAQLRSSFFASSNWAESDLPNITREAHPDGRGRFCLARFGDLASHRKERKEHEMTCGARPVHMYPAAEPARPQRARAGQQGEISAESRNTA